jgi:uncharacterized membrane protein YjgN (DUF898 family)
MTQAVLPREAKPDTPAPERELNLQFRGDAREYFRVWAVNLCLTLFTLGIFSAWAKVRKKRYFYSHTTLDRSPFQYLGQPLPILKGRLIAAALFLLYYGSSHFLTALMPYVLTIGVLLAPWVIVRSAAFNARYSAYRNMTFGFDGRYRDAVFALYWLGLIPLLVAGTIFGWWGNILIGAVVYAVFGLLFPWWMRRLKHFLITHSAFGGENGELSATGRQFFRVYFMAGLVVTLFGALTAGLAAALFSNLKQLSQYAFILPAIPVYVGYVLAFAYVQAHNSNLVWNHTRLGPLRFKSSLTARGLAGLYTGNALAIVASVGLLTPWAVIRTLKYRANHMQVFLDGDLAAFHSMESGAVRAAGAELGEFFNVDLSL